VGVNSHQNPPIDSNQEILFLLPAFATYNKGGILKYFTPNRFHFQAWDRLEKQPMKIISNKLRDALGFTAPMPESLRRKKLLEFMVFALMGIVALSWMVYFLVILFMEPLDDHGNDYVIFGLPIIFLGLAIVLVINSRTDGYLAGFILIAVTFIASTLDDPVEVAEGRSLLYFSIPIILSSLLLRPWAGFVTAGLACIVNISYVVITSGTTVNITAVTAYITLAGIMWLATSGLENSIRHMDISNRALRESEERYRTLVETSPDMVVVSDMLGTIEIVNQAGVKILGYEMESEILGKKTWDLIEPETRQETKELFRKTFITDAIKDSKMEVLACKKDGNPVYIELNNSLVINETTGKPTKIIAVGRDITLRKKAEQQLISEKSRLEDTVRESEEAYQNLVEHSAQGLALYQAGKIIKANNAFAKMCGLTLAEIYAMDGQQLQDMVHPDDITSLLDYFDARFNGASPKYHEFRFLPANGQTRWMECMPLWFNFMRQPAMQLSVIDQTERKLSELALAQSVEQLRALESSLRDAKDALEVRVAARTTELHRSREQLRKLTRKIVNSLEDERRRVSRELHDEAGQILIGLKYRLGEALSGLPPDYETERKKIAMAMDGTDQAMQKIRSLAYALRPPTLDVAGINLALQGLCREFAEQASMLVDYRGVELAETGEEISISLYRILQEALTNVAKHAAGTTRVNVALTRTKKAVVLTIIDNGAGYQSAIDHKGIGLLGMQERLSLLGGHLEISPGKKKGTCLRATIPLPQEIVYQADE
jgi:PAS domain S-box-containing protein